MRKLIFILLFLPFFSKAQVEVISNGEYFTVGYKVGGPTNGKLYLIQGTAQVVAGAPGVINASAGTHNVSFVDSSHHGWTFGDGNQYGQAGLGTSGGSSYGPTQIMTDSAGNPFNNIAYTVNGGNAYGWNTIFVKTDGTIWMCGHLWNRIALRPVQIVLPAGVVAVQVLSGLTLTYLDTAGQVHVRFGGNQGFATQYINPQGTATPDTLNDFVISLPARARRIAGSSFWSFAELVTNRVYGWGPWPGFLGIGDPHDGNSQHGPLSLIPQRVDTGWAGVTLTAPLIDLKANNAAVFFITSDSVLHGFGDATQGTVGDGSHLDFSIYSPIYQWNQSENPAQLLIRKPVVIMPGIHFAVIYSTNALNYDTYAQDGSGQLYSWGRNKGGPLGNGVNECDIFGVIAATYPNSWDVFWPAPVDPWTVSAISSTCPFCITNPSGSPCSSCSNPANIGPTANGGGSYSPLINVQFLLNGSGSSAVLGLHLVYYQWTHLSGPNGPVNLPGFSQSPMKNTIIGTDTYQLKVTDNYWGTNTINVTAITLFPNTVRLIYGGKIKFF